MKISEFALIARLKKNLATASKDLIAGIGDDCAVLRKDKDAVWLVSTDSLVENVHFELRHFSFLELGKKALSVNLSDIAAMAGTPLYALVSLGIPPRISAERIEDFYTGLQQAGQEFGISIVGGDMSNSPKSFFASLTVIGTAKNGEYKLRSAAKTGDGIYVSGNLGSSALGFRLLQKRRVSRHSIFVLAHKNPTPRIRLGRTLAEFPEVHAAIDLSDGLVQDLGHILEASGVGAEIHFEDLPREKSFEETCRAARLNPEETLLSGGEDYQLLFTMDSSKENELQKHLAANRIRITRIGSIVAKDESSRSPSLRVFRDGAEIKINRTGFDHFSSATHRKKKEKN